ncbi:MAG: hypothetical protein KC425_14470, partial [Anaerolineales bacterium]|nr:hypothetical protein [Anaerolineales bacterium]
RTDTTSTSTQFTPAVPGQLIWFRSQATDRAGNAEPPNPNGDMSTAQAIVLSHAIMLPIVMK